MKYEEFREKVKEFCLLIYPHEIYYPLKQYKVRRILDVHVNVIRICVVLTRLGFPITNRIITEILRGDDYKISQRISMNQILAKLGDKRVLYLIGYGSYGSLTYTVNDDFNSLININYDKIDEFKIRLEKEGLQIE